MTEAGNERHSINQVEVAINQPTVQYYIVILM